MNLHFTALSQCEGKVGQRQRGEIITACPLVPFGWSTHPDLRRASNSVKPQKPNIRLTLGIPARKLLKTAAVDLSDYN